MRSKPASQIQRLAETAAALREGKKSLPVTRLTVLKRLCQDVRGGTRFLVYLAAAARDQMGREPRRRDGSWRLIV